MSLQAIIFKNSSFSVTVDQLYMDAVVLSITTSGGASIKVSPFNEKSAAVTGHTKQEGVAVMLTSIGLKPFDAMVSVIPHS